jgi:sortase A
MSRNQQIMFKQSGQPKHHPATHGHDRNQAAAYYEVAGRHEAAALMRHKIALVLADGLKKNKTTGRREPLTMPRSSHEEFFYGLLDSQKNLAEMITEWHAYYDSLPPAEKHEVWRQFYGPQAAAPAGTASEKQLPEAPYRSLYRPGKANSRDDSQAADLDTTEDTAGKQGGFFSGYRQLRSLGFGLACGGAVVMLLLFGFFNEVILSPFIQPSQKASSVPIIVDAASATADPTTRVIIPKINVEIPVDYTMTTTEDAAFQKALDNGVVHYPATVRPGQEGNAAFFGHSSNNIFNPGKYKFAFVLLHKLVPKDIFYITYGNKMYAYEVITTKIVAPSEVGVLGPVPGEKATATLITCDPPGTSINRLVVIGKQISPDPNNNASPTEVTPIRTASESIKNLPGNGTSLWSRLWHTVF